MGPSLSFLSIHTSLHGHIVVLIVELVNNAALKLILRTSFCNHHRLFPVFFDPNTPTPWNYYLLIFSPTFSSHNLNDLSAQIKPQDHTHSFQMLQLLCFHFIMLVCKILKLKITSLDVEINTYSLSFI